MHVCEKMRIRGRLLTAGLLLGGLPGGAPGAPAETCGYATRNYYLYLEQCRRSDGCRARLRAEQLVRNACGGALPDGHSVQPALDAARREALQTMPSIAAAEDCPALVAKLKRLRADGLDAEAFGLRKAIAERVCGGPVDLDAAADDRCGAERLRRQQVLALWEQKMRHKDAALRQGVRDLLQLRQDLLDDARWVGSGREIAATILKPLDSAGKLFENLLGILPGTSKLADAARATRVVSSHILDGLKSGKKLYDLVNDDLEKLWINAVMRDGARRSPVAAALKALFDLTRDLDTIAALPGQFRATRAEVAAQIAVIDAQIGRLLQRLRADEQLRARVEDYAAQVEAAQAQRCPDARRLP